METKKDRKAPLIEFVVRLSGMETSTLNNSLKPILDGMLNRAGRPSDMDGGFRFNPEFTDQCRYEQNEDRVMKHTDVANSVPFTT